ncbi:MAG: hypothetical protein PHY56_07900 [Candidatus Omnitrophica bacterium]|nr:hypothetical protein [Candidatus Omnitrophota bacterium]
MNTTYIQEVRTENTGGGIMVDFVTLIDGKVIVILSDMIAIYKNMEDYDNNEEPLTHWLT